MPPLTKASLKRNALALEAFHKYYIDIYGEDRWHQSLFPALSDNTRYCAMINKFAEQTKALQAITVENEDDTHLSKIHLPDLQRPGENVFAISAWQTSSVIRFPNASVQKAAVNGQRELMTHWCFDAASLLAAHMLGVNPGDKVLDLCAAPGGKSIALSQHLFASDHSVDPVSSKSLLVSNESDRPRNKRLQANLEAWLPPGLFEDGSVKIIEIDATQKSATEGPLLKENSYDRILVDAPCSSERHIIHAHLSASRAGQIADEMSNWKPSASKNLAKTQSALLMTALRAVKVGGTVLYATCSLSHEENDGVIAATKQAVKLLMKKQSTSAKEGWKLKIDQFNKLNTEALAILNSMTEKTKYGRIALPDHPNGGKWGPLYFCKLLKVLDRSSAVSDTAQDAD